MKVCKKCQSICRLCERPLSLRTKTIFEKVPVRHYDIECRFECYIPIKICFLDMGNCYFNELLNTVLHGTQFAVFINYYLLVCLKIKPIKY